MVDSDAYLDWESVYRDNIDRLYRLMYSKVGNRSDAEDLTSEVFKNALVPLRIGSSKGEVRSYLLTTAQTVLAASVEVENATVTLRAEVERFLRLGDRRRSVAQLS